MGELEKLAMYIDGQKVAPASGEYFESFNPYTGKPWALPGHRYRSRSTIGPRH